MLIFIWCDLVLVLNMLLCDASRIAILHIHALASHLGTLDEPCEELKNVMLEPNPKTVFGGPIPKIEGPLECMPRVKMFPKTVQAN